MGTVFILGGAGLVGAQIAHQVARELRPDKIIIASLYQKEVRDFAHEIRKEFPHIIFVELWGNLFVRAEYAREDRGELIMSPSRRRGLYEDLFGSLDEAYQRSLLTQSVPQHKPQV